MKNLLFLPATLALAGAASAQTLFAQDKLLASDGAAVDSFGFSVSISGDTAVIGAPLDEFGSGSAYVFEHTGGDWVETAKLLSSDGEGLDRLGLSVSLAGERALVGSPFHDDQGKDSGAAYVFVRTPSGWREEAKLLASDGTGVTGSTYAYAIADRFGSAVALSGDRALVGAPGHDDQGDDSGAAYMFVRTPTGWVEEAKLLASDGAAIDWFGSSLSLDGDRALVGAKGRDDQGYQSGAAYAFVRTLSGWVEEAKLLASDGGVEDHFGSSVSLDGDRALVGANALAVATHPSGKGAAYVFVRTPSGWVEETKLVASDGVGATLFGNSVSLDGDRALVGAYADDDQGYDSGAAYAFVRTPSGWVEEVKLLASDGAANDIFGESVSLSGDRALGGARFHGDLGPSSGAAYVFELIPSQLDAYGCGVNPADSLVPLSGGPTVGETSTLGVDNPLGTQAAPSIPFLALSTSADAAYPCGTVVPGLGMAGPGAAGELLVSLVSPNPLDVLTGSPWTGPGNPAAVSFSIPDSADLVGLTFFAQGLLWDPSTGAPVPLGLTNALELSIGWY